MKENLINEHMRLTKKYLNLLKSFGYEVLDTFITWYGIKGAEFILPPDYKEMFNDNEAFCFLSIRQQSELIHIIPFAENFISYKCKRELKELAEQIILQITYGKHEGYGKIN